MRSYQEIQSEVSQIARHELHLGLVLCTDEQRHFFKRLYSGGDLTLPLTAVINRIPETQLKCAMQQVQRTLEKNAERRQEEQ